MGSPIPSVTTTSASPGRRSPATGATWTSLGRARTALEARSLPAFFTAVTGCQRPAQRVSADESPAATASA